ncbi:thiamine diphosphokinase [Cereibacter azotoformans]|nr:thiamine diphosphokinase [Cereibacter azotoformans]AXQ95048.1 thiamine diphosphokinase [Cereibacter sphaeroides]MBO4169326.1 thiamine diphosphokinase [Cereibacter azotoformans]UIJ31285.1 thiamine diphosphokinase [Cereibacter azotoformans]ULB09094.1 thiamine diphosphokinase [Cereibacter azotoformans]
MTRPIVESTEGVTLVAGGPVTRRDLSVALARAPVLVAADGGGDSALRLGRLPQAVIGDMDSLSHEGREALRGRVHHLPEQETTDFDKCLRSIRAPFVLALGVAGARIDHGLAVMNVLVRRTEPVCLLVGPQDVVFHAPPELRLRLKVGERISLFPLGPVTGESRGLRWPIDGIPFAPDGRVGTSNAVAEPEVRLAFDGPGMLVILPRARLDRALRALVPGWRAGATTAARGR